MGGEVFVNDGAWSGEEYLQAACMMPVNEAMMADAQPVETVSSSVSGLVSPWGRAASAVLARRRGSGARLRR